METLAWERKKQEKVGGKSEEKNGECVLKSGIERTKLFLESKTPSFRSAPFRRLWAGIP